MQKSNNEIPYGGTGSGPAKEDILDQLLSGAIEMHVHGFPDVVPRKMTDIGLLRAAKAAGMYGVMIKCHVTPTTGRAALAQEAVGGIRAFGGVVLNRQVGGLNPPTVEAELCMGAKEVKNNSASTR